MTAKGESALSGISDENETAFSGRTKTTDEKHIFPFAWVPIPFFLVLIGFLWQMDYRFVFEPPFLLAFLNFTFSAAVSFFVAYMAALSFSRNASVPVLLLGCGMLFFGMVSLIAPIAIHFGQINIGITVYNTGMCLSGACHLLAAAASISSERRINRHAVLVLSGVYAVVLSLTGLLAYMAFEGLMPVFFIQGEGASVLRQAVLGAAVGCYAVSGFIIEIVSLRYRWHFGRWYALSLGLIATGLLGVLLIDTVGSPLGWAGRAAQYLGGLYMFGAVLVAARKGGEWDAVLQVALKESEERFRILVEATFEGIAISDNGVIIDANEQLARMLGYDDGDLIGKRLADLIPADDWERVIENIFSGRGTAEEHGMLKRDGSRIMVESHGRTIFRNGRQIRHSAIRDITERRLAEQALRRSDERLRMAADAAEIGMWHWDLVTDQLDLNEQTYRIFGLVPTSELEFEQLQRWIHPEDLSAVRESTAYSLSHAGPHELQYRIIRPDGKVRWLLAKGLTHLGIDGEPAQNIGILVDFTERKRIEEDLRRARDELEIRVKDRTAELRKRAGQLARLTSELTMSEQRERQRLAQVLHDHLQQLLAGAKLQLETLVLNLADEQKESARKIVGLLVESLGATRSLTMELSPPVLRNEGLSAAVKWLADWMEETHGLSVDLKSDTRAEIEQEDLRIMIFQSIRELLFNVVKHAGVNQAGIELHLREDGFLQVSVSDHGNGFESAELMCENRGAGGFGLFSIRERVILTGGRFEIDSTVGSGARFTMIVPVATIPDPMDDPVHGQI